jgi:Flp pilus assembly protein TadB
VSRDPEVHRITSAQPDPSAESVHRERQYLILMGIRMMAIVVAVVVPGIWRWIAVAAGITLPYFAVVLVNAAKVRGTEADPNCHLPEPTAAISDAPFSGEVIRQEQE